MTNNSTYRITLAGSREHGTFEVVTPLSLEHQKLINDEPLFESNAILHDEHKSSVWLGGSADSCDYYGEYYQRAKDIATLITMTLTMAGAKASLTPDLDFERKMRIRQV